MQIIPNDWSHESQGLQTVGVFEDSSQQDMKGIICQLREERMVMKGRGGGNKDISSFTGIVMQSDL
jgi:hypothetical protein